MSWPWYYFGNIDTYNIFIDIIYKSISTNDEPVGEIYKYIYIIIIIRGGCVVVHVGKHNMDDMQLVGHAQLRIS